MKAKGGHFSFVRVALALTHESTGLRSAQHSNPCHSCLARLAQGLWSGHRKMLLPRPGCTGEGCLPPGLLVLWFTAERIINLEIFDVLATRGPRREVQGKRGTWWLCGMCPHDSVLCLCGGVTTDASRTVNVFVIEGCSGRAWVLGRLCM